MEATFAPTIRMHHATRAKAERLVAMLAAEYPRLTLAVAESDEPIDHEVYETEAVGFEVYIDEEEVVWEGPKVPELADILDACAEQEIDPTETDEDEEEEPELTGSIVPNKYRAAYREVSSTGQCNGDWLAEQLAADTLDAEGKLDLNGLIAVYEANELDLNAKWAVARFAQTRGWQGRFRMSGRVVLEKAVALRGTYITVSGAPVVPSAEWLEQMEAKHGKWLAKQRKIETERAEAEKDMAGA